MAWWKGSVNMASAFSRQAMLNLYRNVLRTHKRVLPQVVSSILYLFHFSAPKLRLVLTQHQT